MRRPLVRALSRPLILAAAAVAIPLGSAAPAASDGVVVGGFPVDVSQSPWTVALSSRDRFGGMRSGQFCGGVAVGPSTVLTAAHCMGEDVLGAPPGQLADLKVVAGRTDLYRDTGQEVSVRSVWVNPGYDGASNAGDFAVLTLAQPLPAAAVIPMAAEGDPAYEAGDGGRGLRLGRQHRVRCVRPQSASGSCACAVRRVLRAGLPGYLGRHLRRAEHGVRRGGAGWSGCLPGGQRRAAGRKGPTHRPRVMGQRLWAAGKSRCLHAGLRRREDARLVAGARGPRKAP